jgi:arylsulfatase A-like enzyme
MEYQVDRRQFLKLLSLMSSLPLLESQGRSAAMPTSLNQSHGQPNVIILLFDTLSARHLSMHGYPRETTPNLTRFAEKATVYHAHYAAGNFTTPSTASLLTGAYPWAHRAFHHSGIVTMEYQARNLFRLVGDAYSRILYPHNLWTDLLLHQFRQDGDIYVAPEEFCLADHTFPDQWFPNDADIAFRSFEDLLFREISFPGSLFLSFANKIKTLHYERTDLNEYAELYPRGVPKLGIYNTFFLLEDVIDGIMALLGNSHQPTLAYFHLFPPHEPYRPRREFVGIFEDGWIPPAKEPHLLSAKYPQAALDRWRLEYDEYIAYTDAEFGRLYDFLDRIGLLNNSYVVLTSDHGQLFERGVHGHDTELLYEPVIHIPLMISRPGQHQREDVYAPTSCVDLLPTLLDAIGQPIPHWCQGKVLPASSGERDSDESTIFSVEAKRNSVYSPLTVGTIALIRGQYKLIHYFGYAGYESEYELYDLANDPEELEDLYSTKRMLAADLRDQLEKKLREVNQPYTRGKG